MKYFSNKLAHHGIKGQKWGVRRFQNKDGSLTTAGKKRMDRAQSDARALGNVHARLEDSNRILTRGVQKGSNILVPKETKKRLFKTDNELRKPPFKPKEKVCGYS